MLKRGLFYLIAIAWAPLSLGAAIVDGEALERQMWADMKGQNWNAVESRISQNFQSIHSDGTRDRYREIDLIRHLELGEYTLSDFKVTQTPGTFIVTYTAAVKETIDAESLPSKPTPRLSVWQNNNGTWQWITHANFNPVSGL